MVLHADEGEGCGTADSVRRRTLPCSATLGRRVADLLRSYVCDTLILGRSRMYPQASNVHAKLFRKRFYSYSARRFMNALVGYRSNHLRRGRLMFVDGGVC